MAVEVERLIVTLEANMSQYSRQLLLGQQATERALQRIDQRFAQTASNVRMSAVSMGTALGSIGTYLGAREVLDYANTWTRVTRSLDASGRTFGITLKSASQIVDLANDARVDLDAYSKTFQRTAAAIRDYGLDADVAARVTSTLAKALKLGSASASEQASTLLQVGQFLNKGKLDGDEFKTVMENANIVQELLAKRLGVTKGEIIKMAAEGKIRILDFVGAMEDGGEKIDRIYREMPATVDEAFTVLTNNVTRFVGELDQAHGASKAVADGLVVVSKNLDAVAVAAGAVAGSAALRLAVFAASTVAAANPVTALAAAVGALSVAYMQWGDRIELADGSTLNLKTSLEAFADVVGGDLKSSLDQAIEMAAAMRDQIIDTEESLGQSIATWKHWGQTVGSALYTGLKAMIPFGDEVEALLGRTADRIAKRKAEIEASMALEGRGYGAGLSDYLTGKRDFAAKPMPAEDPAAKASEFSRAVREIEKRTAAMRAELEVIGATTAAQERAKALSDLRFAAIQTAAKQGRAVTAEETAAIEKLAEAYASASVEVAFLQTLQAKRDETAELERETVLTGKWGFELSKARTQLELINAAKKAGIALTPERQAEIDAVAEQNARAREYLDIINQTRDNSREALKGFITDMRDGASATEALGNALNRISDKLIDMAVNSLVESAMGPLFGTGGGGGLLSGLLGGSSGGWDTTVTPFAKGGIAANGKALNLPTFANGGVSRSAAIFGEAGPEAAIPLPDGRRVPVDLRMPSANGTAAAPNVNLNVSFNVQNGTPEGVEAMNRDTLPKIRQIVKAEIASTFDRSARFSRSGI